VWWYGCGVLNVGFGVSEKKDRGQSVETRLGQTHHWESPGYIDPTNAMHTIDALTSAASRTRAAALSPGPDGTTGWGLGCWDVGVGFGVGWRGAMGAEPQTMVEGTKPSAVDFRPQHKQSATAPRIPQPQIPKSNARAPSPAAAARWAAPWPTQVPRSF